MSGAYAIPTDSTVSEKFLGHSLSSKLEAKSGFALMAAFGYDVSENLSVEAELGYRNFRFSKFKGLDISGPRVSGSINGKFPVKGSISALSLMGNGVFSARIWEVKPYFGPASGWRGIPEDSTSRRSKSATSSVEYPGASANKVVFAYQAMAGVAYPVSDQAEIRAGYRYFATTKADFKGTEATYGTHNFEAGVRFRF